MLGTIEAPFVKYAAFISNYILAPDSNDKEAYYTSFYVKEKSVIRIRAYSDTEDLLKITLKKKS